MMRRRNIVFFAVHQFISTVGIIVGTAFIMFCVTSIIHMRWESIGNRTASAMLTELPFFPIQTAVAFFLGTALLKRFRQPGIFWVWAIPAMILLAAISHGPIAEIGIDQNYGAIRHFFGDGCQPANRCFDQIVFTLPLYTAIAYAMGAAFRQIFSAVRANHKNSTHMEPTT